jgi:hypothetical protein
VGFIVQPSSKAVTLDAQGSVNCKTEDPLVLSETSETDIVYTYNVEWKVNLPVHPHEPLDSITPHYV